MTAPHGFRVETTQIRRHAATVAKLAANLSSVAGALPGSMAGSPLGSFVQFLSDGLGSAMAKAGESAGHASSAMSTIGEALTRAADSYERVDQDTIDRLRRETSYDEHRR
jgi:hypothetical protein